MKTFEAEYKNLNAEQKKAVETLEGPLLVVAGPGTGKTQLLSMRAANILKKTDAKANNILCLTFTNKAAVNMKERIVRLAGAEGGRIGAKTFHSFAAEIMNLYPDYFWNAARLSVAPETVQLDIIESIVEKLPLDNPLGLKFAGQYTLLNDIQASINLAKDAGLTPKKLEAVIKANLAYIDLIEAGLAEACNVKLSGKNLDKLQAVVNELPSQNISQAAYPLASLSEVIVSSLEQAVQADSGSGKAANTSAWKRRWVQSAGSQKGMHDERRRNQWWLELANVYAQYREALHSKGFYDYADMLVEVISVLEQSPEVLADIQERFNYVMMDEFQDTNPAQLRLAHLVADHESANGQPNLMAVGDDDQSIYKFQGAELDNMLNFAKAYKTAEIIVLTSNYRSSQAILDSSAKIISQAHVRLVNSNKNLKKNLVAKNPPRFKGQIKASMYGAVELELSTVARQIKSRHKPGREIAVLARSHSSLLKITSLLTQLKVPVRYEQQSNVLEHEIIEQVYMLGRLLNAVAAGDKPAANELLHIIIRHPLWGIEPKALWQLALDNYYQPDWLGKLASSKDKKLSTLASWVLRLSQAAASQPLPVTIEMILGLRPLKDFTSPLRAYFTSGKENTNKYFHALSALQLLRSLAHEFAAGGEPSLADFVRFIEINRQNGVVVADQSPFVTGPHYVQLLTVHKAKGLEFDEVYIIDCTEDNWQPRKGRRKPPANLPLQPVGDDQDDYVRLMYVAATRARDSLFVSSHRFDHAGKEISTSPIAQAAFEFENVKPNNDNQLVETLEENLRWPSLDKGQEKDMLKARLEEYSLSVTHLLNFLDVTRGGPAYFKERNLLRLPEAKSAVASYGTAMHAALETAQRLTNRGLFAIDKIEEAFTKTLRAEQQPAANFERYKKEGLRTLNKLFGPLNLQLPKGSLPEQRLTDIRQGSARLNGKLDRVDMNGSRLAISDYKTGRPLSSLDTKDKALAVKAHKHRLQLVFYSLIARQNPAYASYSDIDCQMVYLQADQPKDLIKNYNPSPAEIKRLGDLIEKIWAKIMTLDLPNTRRYGQTIDGLIAFEEDLLNNRI